MSTNKRMLFIRSVFTLLTAATCLVVGTASALAQSVDPSDCTRANPVVAITPGSQSAFPGNQLKYSITVTSNDSAACKVSSYTIVPTFTESGFRQVPEAVSLVLPPGGKGSRDVIIIAPGQACVGPRTIRETATNDIAPDISGFADLVFDVIPIVPDCGHAAPTVTISPATRAADSGEALVFTVSVKNNDSPACGSASGFLVTPTLSPGLSAQIPNEFNIVVPVGGTASRNVTIRSDLFGSGNLAFTETARNDDFACVSGSGMGTFTANRTLGAMLGFCCTGAPTSTPDGGQRFPDCSIEPDILNPTRSCPFLIACPNGRSNGDGSVTCFPGPFSVSLKKP